MQYIVMDRENAVIGGKDKTRFSLYRKVGRSFLFSGKFLTDGWDQSEALCLAAALAQINEQEEDEGEELCDKQ